MPELVGHCTHFPIGGHRLDAPRVHRGDAASATRVQFGECQMYRTSHTLGELDLNVENCCGCANEVFVARLCRQTTQADRHRLAARPKSQRNYQPRRQLGHPGAPAQAGAMLQGFGGARARHEHEAIGANRRRQSFIGLVGGGLDRASRQPPSFACRHVPGWNREMRMQRVTLLRSGKPDETKRIEGKPRGWCDAVDGKRVCRPGKCRERGRCSVVPSHRCVRPALAPCQGQPSQGLATRVGRDMVEEPFDHCAFSDNRERLMKHERARHRNSARRRG